jgi:hypothetical protein
MRGHRYFVRGCLSAALSAVVGAGMALAPAPASAQTGISGARTSLKLFWRAAVGDNFTSRDETEPNYERIRVEGHVFTTQHPGTSPLKLFFHAGRNDSSLVGTAKGEAEHLAAGYAFVRIEGYAFQQPFPGTVPLKLYWHEGRGDNAVVAETRSQQDQIASGYKYVRVEAYVFPANDPDFGIRKFPLRALVPGQTGRLAIASTKTAFIVHADTAGNGCPYTWIGTTGRHPHDVVLTICNTGIVGMVQYNGTLYEIDPFELDREEAFDYRAPPSTLPLSPVGTIIDVGIAYSPAVNQEYGAMAKSLGLSIEPRLYLAAYQQLAIDHANAILGASGAATTLRLARTKQLSIFESAFSSPGNALGEIAERGVQPCGGDSDPYGVKAFRDFTGADIVSIWLGNPPLNKDGGAAWVAPSTWWCDHKLAYSVVWGANQVFKNYAFVHEIGHNLGVLHAHGEPTEYNEYDVFQTYGYGHVDAVNGFRDVMAYGDKCQPTNGACPALPYFSTPSIRLDPVTKARVASGGVAMGASSANAVQRIRENTANVAGYRTLKCPGTMTSCGGGTGGTPPTSPNPDPELPPTEEK